MENQSLQAKQNSAKIIANDTGKVYMYILYALFFLGLFTGIFGIIGVVIAYIKKSDFHGTIYYSHTEYLIKTFWINFIISIIGLILFVIVIGYFILLIIFIWALYRIIKGLIYFLDGKPMSQAGLL